MDEEPEIRKRKHPRDIRKERRNKSRTDRYANDPEYRRKVQESSKKSFNKKKTSQSRVRVFESSPSRLCRYGEVRHIIGQDEASFTFNVEEIARVMGNHHPIVIRNWHRDGRFPKPNHVTKVGNSYLGVYDEFQTRAMALILRKHFNSSSYFTHKHKEVIKALHEAMNIKKHEDQNETESVD